MKKITKKQKEKIRKMSILISSFFLIILVMSLIGTRIGNNSNKSDIFQNAGLDFQNIQVAKPEILSKLLTPNKNSRPGIALTTVKGIVVHYTANPGTSAMANRNYFESRKGEKEAAANKVSSHYIIGITGKIVQCIPENEIAYASNNRNGDTISIECCHPDSSGKFTQKTYDSLVHLTSYLCDKYEIEPNNIIRHYDVTKKLCPKYYVKNPNKWRQFHKDVTTYLESHLVKK